MKKIYRAPELNTRKIELGVFGDYSDNGNGNNSGKDAPMPIIVIRDLHLHMD